MCAAQRQHHNGKQNVHQETPTSVSTIVDQRQQTLCFRARALGCPSKCLVKKEVVDVLAVEIVPTPGRHYISGEAKCVLNLKTCLPLCALLSKLGGCRVQSSIIMVKKRVLDPIPVLDEALLLEALREEGIKEVSISNPSSLRKPKGNLQLSHRSSSPNTRQPWQASRPRSLRATPPPSRCPVLLDMHIVVFFSLFRHEECR